MGAGWFLVNVANAAGWRSADLGEGVGFESREHPFAHVGVNVHVLQPGQASCRYHLEPAQEAFLVLRGRCLLVVEEEERDLGLDRGAGARLDLSWVFADR